MRLNDGRTTFYTWHSLRRYAQRYMGDTDAEIDTEFIGDLLVYNTIGEVTEYEYKGHHTKMMVTLDGAWLCDNVDDSCCKDFYL